MLLFAHARMPHIVWSSYRPLKMRHEDEAPHEGYPRKCHVPIFVYALAIDFFSETNILTFVRTTDTVHLRIQVRTSTHGSGRVQSTSQDVLLMGIASMVSSGGLAILYACIKNLQESILDLVAAPIHEQTTHMACSDH